VTRKETSPPRAQRNPLTNPDLGQEHQPLVCKEIESATSAVFNLIHF
jgi:hypothetical protein